MHSEDLISGHKINVFLFQMTTTIAAITTSVAGLRTTYINCGVSTDINPHSTLSIYDVDIAPCLFVT